MFGFKHPDLVTIVLVAVGGAVALVVYLFLIAAWSLPRL